MAKCNELFQEREEYFEYLDELRESGKTNMFGARQYLMDEFGLDKEKAANVLSEWMTTFGSRTANKKE